MLIMKKTLLAVALGVGTLGVATGASAAEPIPRAASTPNTPKNWAGPGAGVKILAQKLVDEVAAAHPEVMSITIHATPPGHTDMYTMIAGTFPDRIGNESSPGDVITAKKGVSQVESKWGTPDYGKKVSTVLPLKDSTGAYLPAAMVIAFHTAPGNGKIDTDFLAPGLAIRDGLNRRIPQFASLFEAVK
ncbi:hypothetical protein [Dokdonella sp.]|uniref:hypothetical protein n=1 Tax=Dokdonella sp. TaxID=2291710 RepID=UPI00262F3400|nr:hypothetical protein [Dokdonella sp.]